MQRLGIFTENLPASIIPIGTHREAIAALNAILEYKCIGTNPSLTTRRYGMTRIFKVNYGYEWKINGKREGQTENDSMNMVAVDAAEAIYKVRAIATKTSRYLDGKKKVVAERIDFDPIGVTLVAEA
jgi:hypothetical protein